MAEWFCGGDGLKAEALFFERPARFYEILGWANAEGEAEEPAEKYRKSKEKLTEAHNEFAQDTGKKRRHPRLR